MSERLQCRHGLEPALAVMPHDIDDETGVIIQIQNELGHINLRGAAADPNFTSTVSSVLGQALPIAHNSMSRGKHHVFWLGPEEWLVMGTRERIPGLITGLRKALAKQHASVAELSGGQVVMRLAGPGARDVLAKGCTLDFCSAEFGVGACAQSALAKAPVLVGLIDDNPVFEIVVRRSFAEYLVLWLADAAAEFKVAFSEVRWSA